MRAGEASQAAIAASAACGCCRDQCGGGVLAPSAMGAAPAHHLVQERMTEHRLIRRAGGSPGDPVELAARSDPSKIRSTPSRSDTTARMSWSRTSSNTWLHLTSFSYVLLSFSTGLIARYSPPVGYSSPVDSLTMV